VTLIAPTCLVFPWEVAGGPANMARDEALLDFVGEGPSTAGLRLYGWNEPTLSLGYFQSIAEAEENPRWRGLPQVRRPTGGGALLHDQEVTYAIALPRTHTIARQTSELYKRVHAAIVELLEECGVGAGRRGDVGDKAVRVDTPRPFLCFADRDSEDVISGGAKLAGSAQRRRSGAVLQHGSILIASSTITPELPGATDLGMRPADLADWASRLAWKILARLELVPAATAWPAHLLQRSGAIERSVYRNESWTRRR
jgi:lipoate-protein ligase A